MKTTFFVWVAWILCVSVMHAEAPKLPEQARLAKSSTGRVIDPTSGLPNTPISLKKGMIYDVLDKKLGTVTVEVEGQKVAVNAQDVVVTPKPAALQNPTSAYNGGGNRMGQPFTPGQLVLLSAKYSLAGNQPRNVKARVQKYIPSGVISAPIEFLVTDNLSTAAQGQGDGIQNVTVVVTPTIQAVTVQKIEVPKNVLRVEYSFNGQLMVKEALEGTKMVLP